MHKYHVAFWSAAALSCVLLTLAVVALTVVGHRQRTSLESALAAVLTLALGTVFTISMTCLGLRRDFMRPLAGAVIMSLLFMSVLGLLVARISSEARPNEPETPPNPTA